MFVSKFSRGSAHDIHRLYLRLKSDQSALKKVSQQDEQLTERERPTKENP